MARSLQALRRQFALAFNHVARGLHCEGDRVMIGVRAAAGMGDDGSRLDFANGCRYRQCDCRQMTRGFARHEVQPANICFREPGCFERDRRLVFASLREILAIDEPGINSHSQIARRPIRDVDKVRGSYSLEQTSREREFVSGIGENE